MNSFKLFGLMRKLATLSQIESFCELHSSATEEEKDEKTGSKVQFFSQLEKI